MSQASIYNLTFECSCMNKGLEPNVHKLQCYSHHAGGAITHYNLRCATCYTWMNIWYGPSNDPLPSEVSEYLDKFPNANRSKL